MATDVRLPATAPTTSPVEPALVPGQTNYLPRNDGLRNETRSVSSTEITETKTAWLGGRLGRYTSYSGTGPLALGHKGPKVRELNDLLEQARVHSGGAWKRTSRDPFFGRGTEASVKNFQKWADLPVTGEVDDRTWSAIKAAADGSGTANTRRASAEPATTPSSSPSPSGGTRPDWEKNLDAFLKAPNGQKEELLGNVTSYGLPNSNSPRYSGPHVDEVVAKRDQDGNIRIVVTSRKLVDQANDRGEMVKVPGSKLGTQEFAYDDNKGREILGRIFAHHVDIDTSNK